MAKIGTKLPHAGDVINGVRFSPRDPDTGERVSESDVVGVTLDTFKAAEGFYIIGKDGQPAGGKKGATEQKGGKPADPPKVGDPPVPGGDSGDSGDGSGGDGTGSETK